MNRSIEGRERRERFIELCRALRPELFRFAFWLSRDRTLAEDIVQETLLRAWRAQNELRDERALKAWLCTIVRREHARLYERKRLPTVDIDGLIEREESMLAVVDDAELEDLRRAIFRLDDDYREPLTLQVLLGFTTEEIAQHMGLSTAAVLTRLFRARNRLRKIVSGEPAGEVSDPRIESR
jgi:RNA polymerase sigma-70 factor (ECF subfamily)